MTKESIMKITGIVQECFKEPVDVDLIKKILDLYANLSTTGQYKKTFQDATSIEIIFVCELLKQYFEYKIALKFSKINAIDETEIVDFCQILDDAILSVAPDVAMDLDSLDTASTTLTNERRFS